MFDYLIAGCGLSGATCARLLAEGGRRVLIVEKRNHLGGNAYDCYNEHGILVHRYGPHIFHTGYREVWEFLAGFTRWRNYQHRVLASVRGMLVPLPINLDTINMLYGTSYDTFSIPEFYRKVVPGNLDIQNARDMVVSQVGEELYELFFAGYTRKQWGMEPEDLAKEVTARMPVRYDRDGRYFTDPYQGVPLDGYTRLVENMLDHENVKVLLNTDFKDIRDEVGYRELIFTGPVDYFFDYKFGPLPYRSLRFVAETHETEFYQPVGVVNYPNDYDFTRITEFKHLTGQKSVKTTVFKEYSAAEGEPYYPVPRRQNRDLYRRYAEEAAKLENVYFLGRLGRYKYANMDVAVKDAMELAAAILK